MSRSLSKLVNTNYCSCKYVTEIVSRTRITRLLWLRLVGRSESVSPLFPRAKPSAKLQTESCFSRFCMRELRRNGFGGCLHVQYDISTSLSDRMGGPFIFSEIYVREYMRVTPRQLLRISVAIIVVRKLIYGIAISRVNGCVHF